MNPVERLVFRLWPHAQYVRGVQALKKSPFFLQRLASFVQQPEIVERILERPFVVRWRISRLMAVAKSEKPLAIGYGFEFYKRRLLRKLYPENHFVFLDLGRKRKTLAWCIAPARDFTAWVWSFRDEADGVGGTFWRDMPVIRVEDGFIRSFGLGSDGTLPFSLCVDRHGLYFDANVQSDLEILANEFDFSARPDMLDEARRLIERIIQSRTTKYNLAEQQLDHAKMPPPDGHRTRILVIGQVEDDQSILRNRSAIATNESLLEQAIRDNPLADIVFRPHPDVSSGNRKALSTPERLLPAYRPGPARQSLADALEFCDLVYTISSLAGFEALFRGKQVKTFGGPFYAGWGLTDDAMSFPRRTRRLTVLELFALAYIVYPIYFDPLTARILDIDAVLDEIEAQQRALA